MGPDLRLVAGAGGDPLFVREAVDERLRDSGIRVAQGVSRKRTTA